MNSLFLPNSDQLVNMNRPLQVPTQSTAVSASLTAMAASLHARGAATENDVGDIVEDVERGRERGARSTRERSESEESRLEDI